MHKTDFENGSALLAALAALMPDGADLPGLGRVRLVTTAPDQGGECEVYAVGEEGDALARVVLKVSACPV